MNSLESNKNMRTDTKYPIHIIANPKIFAFAIAWLIFLVIVGTISQKELGLYAAQNKFFSSWILWLGIIPLPGGRLTMAIISIALSAFLFRPNVWRINKAGILIMHGGALLLLVGGGITAFLSDEGAMVINENDSSNFIQSYEKKELSIINTSKYIDSLEVTNFDSGLLYTGNILEYNTLPFKIEVIDYFENVKFDGAKIIPIKPNIDPSQNNPGLLYIIKKDTPPNDTLILSSLLRAKHKIISQETFLFELRPKRTYVPFTLELIDVTRVLHPGTNIPKSFSSIVNLFDKTIKRRAIIEMNAPLRYRGYTFYQANYIQTIQGETTGLAVVKNYGRLFPYIATIIMCIGLLFHLFLKLPKLFKK